MSQFVQNGELTPDGKTVIDYLDSFATQEVMKESVDAFNQLSGHVKHYLVHVRTAKLLNESQWLNDYPAAAASVLREAKAKQEAEAEAVKESEEKSAIQAELEKLREGLESARKEISKLKGRNTKLENKLKESEAEAETDEEPVEDDDTPEIDDSDDETESDA